MMNQTEFNSNEAKAVAEIIKIAEEIIREKSVVTVDNQRGPVTRDQHPKSHGCVGAELIVEDVPEDLRIGIFKEPRTYPAWIRFSNSSETIQDDAKPDVRGMAMKVLGVDGEKILEGQQHERTQDFILINSERFFLRDIQDSLEFAETVAALRHVPQIPLLGKLLSLVIFILKFGIFHPTSVMIAISASRKTVSNPLLIQYWSTTAYRLGPHAIKFSLRPRVDHLPDSKTNNIRSKNFLREVMADYLNKQDAFFDFLVQIQTDPRTMPVEDATVRWEAPYRRIGTVKIPKQQFDTEKRRIFDEGLSFNPWHSLAEHAPLGKVNLLRRSVYVSTSNLRRQLNAQPCQEPTEEEYYKIFGSMPPIGLPGLTLDSK